MFFLLLLFSLAFDAQDYPDAGALIVNEEISLTFDKDYKSQQERKFAVHIFNIRGREDYSDVFEKYNRKSHELSLLKTQTRLADGRILEPEKKAVSDLGTVEGLLAPAYQDLRTRTVSYSGVAPGALLEYASLRISKKAPDDKYISGIILFQGHDPILKKVFKLKIPEDSGIKDMVIGNVKAVKNVGDDFINYVWSVDSMPRLRQEPNTVPREYFYPRVLFSNYQDWDEVAQVLYDKFEDKIVLSKEIKEQAETFKGTRAEILKQVYELIGKNWRDIPMGIADADFTPIKSNEVFKNRYGNPLDKCCLALALLKALEIEAYPGFVSYSSLNGFLPMPDYFFSAVVAVPEGNGFIFLDFRFPERRVQSFNISGILEDFNHGLTLAPDIIGRPVLVAKPDFGIFATIPDYEAPVSAMQMECELGKDGGMRGKIDVSLKGLPASLARSYLRNKKEKELQNAMEMLLGSIKTGTVVEKYELRGLDDPLQSVNIVVEFYAAHYLTKQGKNSRFEIPWPALLFFSIEPYFNIAERTTPFTVVNVRAVDGAIKVTYPDEFKIYYQPDDMSMVNDFASASNSYEVSPETITINKNFAFKKSEYGPDDYAALKSVYEASGATDQRFVIFSSQK